MASLSKRCDCDGPCPHPWWYRFQLHRRVYRGSTHTANRQLAQRIADKQATKALERQHGFASIQSPLFSKHIAAYCEWSESANATAYKDRDVLDRVQAITGDRRLNEITPFQIERWKTSRAKDVKQSTVNRELNIVRGCFAKAVQWRKVGSSPVVGVKRFVVDDVRLRILSADEIQLVQTTEPVSVRLLMRVTLESLLRLSEALHVHRRDIGPSWLEVRRKGGKVQRVPATVALCAELKAETHPKSGYVFGEGKKGKVPTQQTATNRVKRLLVTLGILEASHHTLRHTGASVMLAAGHSARAVQEIGGWSSLKTLQRYTHPTGAEMQAAVATIGKQVAVASAVTAANTETRSAKKGTSRTA